MSDLELQRVAIHAEQMAANANTPTDERALWQQIQSEVSTYLAAEQKPDHEPGLFDG